MTQSLPPLVIIGSGLAGYSVARELRKLDTERAILILSENQGDFYSKPTLSNALAAGKETAAIVSNTSAQMAEQLKATIRAPASVTTIDPANASLTLATGESIAYSQLVMAVGADPIHLPLAGSGADAVLSVNHLDDYARFRQALEGKKVIAILGAGLIGCEFANDLVTAGYQVHVIDISTQPLGRLLPPGGGAFMQRKLEAAGITFHLDTAVQQVDRTGQGGLHLALANGETLSADMLLSAIGLRPRVTLAETAGMEVNRGIIVNRHLQTTRYPDIYALGDCAEVAGKVLPFIMPIMHASRALAATLAGNPAPVRYPAMPVLVKTPACPTIVSPPDPGTPGEWQVEEDTESLKALFETPDHQLAGFALLGSATRERAALTPRLPPVLE